MMKTFETNRLVLRPLEPSDVDNLFALYRDQRVMKYITGEPRTRPETEAALERHLEDYRDFGFGLCAAIHKESGKVIGRCGLIPWRTEGPWQAEVAWLFAPEWWGQGLGTECGRAFIHQAWDPLGLELLMARAFSANVGSVRIMEKLGMSLARTLPEEVYYELHRPADAASS